MDDDFIRSLIESQEITNDTLLWSKQIESWTPLSDIEHFKDKCEPPPLPKNYSSIGVQETITFIGYKDKDESVSSSPEETDKSDSAIAGKDTHIYQEVNWPRPWVRYFARMTDLFSFSLVGNFIFALVAPSSYYFIYYYIPELLFGVIMLFLWNFVEAFLLSTWGTTLGKWLLGTSVRDIRGNKLTYNAALSRSFQVWIKGLGLGIPIISFLTIINSYYKLTGKFGKTSWDFQGRYSVQHKKLNPIGVIMVIVINFAYIFFLNI